MTSWYSKHLALKINSMERGVLLVSSVLRTKQQTKIPKQVQILKIIFSAENKYL